MKELVKNTSDLAVYHKCYFCYKICHIKQACKISNLKLQNVLTIQDTFLLFHVIFCTSLNLVKDKFIKSIHRAVCLLLW